MVIELLFSTFTTLFVTIDPVGVLPLFVAMAAPLGRDQAVRLATRSVLISTGVLLFFAVAGNALLSALQVTIDAFRIAGGVLLLVIAIEMVFERRAKRRAANANDAINNGNTETGQDWSSLAIFPLAIPLLAGPGAMTSLLLLSADYSLGNVEYWLVLAMVVVIMGITWLLFTLGGALAHFLTPQVIQIMSRILGVILAALAVEFVLDGLKGAFNM